MTRAHIFVLQVIAQLIAISTLSAIPSGERIVVPLKLNLNAKNSVGRLVDLQKVRGAQNETATSVGIAPGGVTIHLQKVLESQDNWLLKIDRDPDDLLENDTGYMIVPDTRIRIEVTRHLRKGKPIKLPYTVKYSRSTNSAGEIEESLSWIPDYRVEGILEVDACNVTIAAYDVTGDGVFDNKDFLQGTSIGLDRNGDGKIYGRDEWLMGNQIIEFCGKQFVIERLAEDGSSITLVPTLLKPPKVGETIPNLIFTTTKGQRISTTQLNGRVTVLDFWASWCGPCIQEFSKLKTLHEEFHYQFRVISVNVDESNRIIQAREVVGKYNLNWPVVIQGLGQADPIWKTFGSMQQMAIPLYVIIDKQRRVRYAGYGGDDLADLRNELTTALR